MIAQCVGCGGLEANQFLGAWSSADQLVSVLSPAPAKILLLADDKVLWTQALRLEINLRGHQACGVSRVSFVVSEIVFCISPSRGVSIDQSCHVQGGIDHFFCSASVSISLVSQVLSKPVRFSTKLFQRLRVSQKDEFGNLTHLLLT